MSWLDIDANFWFNWSMNNPEDEFYQWFNSFMLIGMAITLLVVVAEIIWEWLSPFGY